MSLITANRRWILLFILSLGGITIFSDETIALSAIVGSLFYFLMLLPKHVRNLPMQRFARSREAIGKLTRYRRDFGIVAGLLFVWHVGAVLARFPSLTAFVMQPNAPGTIGIVIMVILLITSNRWSIKLLRTKWKPLHSLVWFCVPLFLAHGMMHAWFAEQEISIPSLVLFGGAMLFVLLEWFLRLRSGQQTQMSNHRLLLVIAGAALAVLIVFVYPSATLG